MFLAHRGAGAYVVPMSGQAAGSSISSAELQRIHVQDASDMQHARFMESYESRHSDHSFTAAVVSGVTLRGGVGVTVVQLAALVKRWSINRRSWTWEARAGHAPCCHKL